MAGTATLTITGSLTGGLTGSGTFPSNSFTNTAAAENTQNYALANGFNSITVPAAAKGMYLIMAAGNTSVTTLKGVTGDTGLPIAPAGIVAMNFASSPPATIGITITTGTTTCQIIWI